MRLGIPLRPCALAVLVGGFFSASALDPHKALTQFSRTVWTQQQGLPQDTIRAITQTTDGYLWVGTDEGLSRFDGYEFVTFSKDHGDLPANSITALAAGADGSLWIGTRSGLTSYRERRFHTYTSKDGLPDDSVAVLLMDHASVLWIAAGGNLSRFDGKTFTNFLRERDLPMRSVRAITEDARHTLYIAGNNAVARLENGKFISLFEPSVLQADFPGGIEMDRAGHLWIQGVHGLIESTPDGKIKRYGAREGLSDSFGLNSVREDHDGNLWVGTDGGVARLEAGRFHTRAEKEGGEPEVVRCLFEDREGNLWVGSSNGLTRYREDVFSVYGKAEGLPSDEPNAVYQDHAGSVWVGFLDAGVMRSSTGTPSSFMAVAGMPPGRIYSIRETHHGEFLVSTRLGLTRFQNGQIRTFVPPDPQGRKSVYDALEDSSGRIWLALPNGLGELRGDTFRTVIKSGPLLLENSFITLAEGSDGALWVGSIGKGLWRVKGEEQRLYTTADGLGSDQIRSLLPDRDGTLWIATFGGGLSALRDGKIINFTVKDGLLSDNISKLVDDGESLWLSTTRGICRVAKKQLEDFAARRVAILQPVNYGVADGLRSAQYPPELGAGGIRDARGRLWFVTTRGLAVFEPQTSKPEQLPPQVHLIEMSTEGRPLNWTDTPGTQDPQVPAGSGRVQFRYSAIHLSAPDRVQYSYRLDHLDSNWVQVGNRRGVNYNSLKHGHYRFAVRAELPGGLASETAQEFDILPHFYETAWFSALAAVALCALVFMAYRMRVRQVRSRFALVLEERARLAREVHDTLAQGFVGISSQLDVVDMCLPENAQPARASLDLARRMAQHSLTEARRSVMDLRAAALDDQDLAAALESGARLWTAGSGIDVDVDASGDAASLPEDVAHHVLRIAQEAVTNVLKHAHASRISLRLRIEPKQLHLTVADTGCGFEPEDVFTSMHGNFGLIGMRERAEGLGGELRLESQPGKGTQVDVTVPVP